MRCKHRACPPRSWIFFLPLLLLLFAANSRQAVSLTVEAAPAQADPGERMIDERFRVRPGEQLEVRVAYADLDVVTGSNDEARVEVFVKGDDRERARAFFAEQRFSVEQRGDAVRVTSESPQKRWWQSWGRQRRPQIYVRVSVPARFDANVQTSYGDVKVARLEGDHRLRTSYGDVQIEALTGGTIDVNTSYGDIEAGRLEADALTLHTSYGDVDLGALVAGRIEVHTSYGDISAREIEGPATLSTSYGDIQATLRKSAPLSLRTSYGDIALRAPASYAADLELRGSSVRIASSYDFSGALDKKKAEGRIGRGGPLLSARTSHGDVTLRSY